MQYFFSFFWFTSLCFTVCRSMYMSTNDPISFLLLAEWCHVWWSLWHKVTVPMLLNCGVGRRLLRVPWTARRSNQSIWKEISPEYSLEGLTLKLKLQYFGTWCKELTHLKRPWSCWEDNRQEGQGSPNRGNRLQGSDIFISPLSGRRKQITSVRFFFPSVYKVKRRFLLRFCVAVMTPGSTWIQLFLSLELTNALLLWKCFS